MLTIVLQNRHSVRWYRHPSCLPRILQAVGPGTHRLRSARRDPNAREALPGHIPARQHHIGADLRHRNRRLPRMDRLRGVVDVPAVLPAQPGADRGHGRRNRDRAGRRQRHVRVHVVLPGGGAPGAAPGRERGLRGAGGAARVHAVQRGGHRRVQRERRGPRRRRPAEHHGRARLRPPRGGRAAPRAGPRRARSAPQRRRREARGCGAVGRGGAARCGNAEWCGRGGPARGGASGVAGARG